jgi:hypothetical protein
VCGSDIHQNQAAAEQAPPLLARTLFNTDSGEGELAPIGPKAAKLPFYRRDYLNERPLNREPRWTFSALVERWNGIGTPSFSGAPAASYAVRPRHRLVDHTGYLRAFLTAKANPLRSGASAVHTQLTGFRLSLAE